MLHKVERNCIEGTAKEQAQIERPQVLYTSVHYGLIGGNVALIDDGLYQLNNFSTSYVTFKLLKSGFPLHGIFFSMHFPLQTYELDCYFSPKSILK